ncbi:MAG: nitroreductase family protein [Candidatus Thorarchaeota archaeon]
MNKTIDDLLNHTSIRRYLDKEIEPEVLDLLLQAGQRAPSAGNLQNYSLLVLDDKEIMEKIAKDAGAPFLTKAPLCIISLVDHHRFWKLCQINDAPFPFNTADGVFTGMWDAIVSLHNIQVAAESLGLGTCYIGLILETDNKKLLGLPDYVFAAGMLSIGYPEIKPDLRQRLPRKAVVHKNFYRSPSDDEITAYYSDWMNNWNKFYDKLPEEKKKYWNEELGVYNNAQYVTKTVYTEERLNEWSEKMLANIRGAKYQI